MGPIESHKTRSINPALWGIGDLVGEVRKPKGLLQVLIGAPAFRDFGAVDIDELHIQKFPTNRQLRSILT
jgi:hypothetical protein